MGLKPLIFFTLCLSILAIVPLSGQVVDIPDENFKFALTELNVVDTDGNGVPDSNADLNGNNEIEVSEAEAVVHLYIYELNIADLTGIEFFVNLETLICWQNSITELDVQNLNNLRILDANTNLLTSINLSFNNQLEYLDLGINQLTGHLTFEDNPGIRELYLGQNDISSIDISTLTLLEDLIVNSANLSTIDLSGNPLLEDLGLSSNFISSIDLTQNSELRELTMGNNLITSIDLSQNVLLEIISIRQNNLLGLDVSLNPNISVLRCDDNQLTNLNLSNGFNDLINIFNATGNSKLLCVEVDDVDYANSIECNGSGQPSWCVDEQTSYSLNCTLGLDELDDIDLVLFPNPALDLLQIRAPAQWKVEGVYDLSGQMMRLENANIRTIDVSGFASGLYFVRLEGDGRSVVKRFLKQ